MKASEAMEFDIQLQREISELEDRGTKQNLRLLAKVARELSFDEVDQLSLRTAAACVTVATALPGIDQFENDYDNFLEFYRRRILLYACDPEAYMATRKKALAQINPFSSSPEDIAGASALIKTQAVSIKRQEGTLSQLFDEGEIDGLSESDLIVVFAQKILSLRGNPEWSNQQRLKLYGILIGQGLKRQIACKPNELREYTFLAQYRAQSNHAKPVIFLRNTCQEEGASRELDRDRKLVLDAEQLARVIKDGKISEHRNSNFARSVEDLDSFFERLISS